MIMRRASSVFNSKIHPQVKDVTNLYTVPEYNL